MKLVKVVIFCVLGIFASRAALAQEHDAFLQDQNALVKTVKIFPNPATDYLSVKFETPSAKSMKITIHNIIGNQMEMESEVVDDYEIHIKVKDLPVGVYLLAVKDSGNSQGCFKFLKR